MTSSKNKKAKLLTLTEQEFHEDGFFQRDGFWWVTCKRAAEVLDNVSHHTSLGRLISKSEYDIPVIQVERTEKGLITLYRADYIVLLTGNGGKYCEYCMYPLTEDQEKYHSHRCASRSRRSSVGHKYMNFSITSEWYDRIFAIGQKTQMSESVILRYIFQEGLEMLEKVYESEQLSPDKKVQIVVNVIPEEDVET